MALRRNLTNLGNHTPFSFFSNKNFIDQLCDIDENIKPWHNIKIEFYLKDTRKIYWLQIIHALPKTWKEDLF